MKLAICALVFAGSAAWYWSAQYLGARDQIDAADHMYMRRQLQWEVARQRSWWVGKKEQ